MTVGLVSRTVSYATTGSSLGPFSIPFQFFEIAVYLNNVLVSPALYTITWTNGTEGLTGSITYNVPGTEPNGTLRIDGSTVRVQQTEYEQNTAFIASSHEKALDRLTMIVQEMSVSGAVNVADAVAALGAAADAEAAAAAAEAAEAAIVALLAQFNASIYGQCRLVKSGSNLLLTPFNGNLLTINGVSKVIPSSGVSLSPSGAAAATYYYIYAFMSGAVMTLEYSVTAPVVNTSTGIKQKSGDATRTLVGAAYTDTGPAWADTNGKLWVLSHFNRRPKTSQLNLSGDHATSSAVFVELHSSLHSNFLCWSDELAFVTYLGDCTGTNGVVYLTTGIGIDSTSVASQQQRVTSEGDVPFPDFATFAVALAVSGLSEAAAHYATALAKVTLATGTGGTFYGGDTTMIVSVMG